MVALGFVAQMRGAGFVEHVHDHISREALEHSHHPSDLSVVCCHHQQRKPEASRSPEDRTGAARVKGMLAKSASFS